MNLHGETSPLTLVHASKAYPYAQWGPDQYAVMHDGKPVGSVDLQNMAGQETRWWWEITTRESPGVLKGPAASREEAMERFRKAWDGLQTKKAPPAGS